MFIFNADLALSVAMTTVSSVLSIAMLPFNVFIYIQLGFFNLKQFDAGINPQGLLDYVSVGITLASVATSIIFGLLFGFKYPNNSLVNKIANIAGFVSIVLGVFVSSASDEPPWAQTWDVYVATALPLIFGLFASLGLCTVTKLPPPQRVAVAIETAYQNVNIATAIGLALGPESIVVAVIYGGYEAVFFGLFCLMCWKMGWTYAPKDDPFLKVIGNSYQQALSRTQQPLDVQPSDVKVVTIDGKEVHPVDGTELAPLKQEGEDGDDRRSSLESDKSIGKGGLTR